MKNQILNKRNFEKNYYLWHGKHETSKAEYLDYLSDIAEYNNKIQKLSECEIPEAVNFNIDMNMLYPVTKDKIDNAGYLGCDFWQDLWAANIISEIKPSVHYDIGSRIDGFIGHMSLLKQKTVLIDIRPFNRNIPYISFMQGDATNLDNFEDNTIESLSALCSLEHFGLGRYGDPINPLACFKVFDAIDRKIGSGGHFVMSVPVGKEHLEYNAHRVFYARTIINSFQRMKLVEYSVASVDGIEKNVDITKFDNNMNLGAPYFGLFHFIKV